MMVDSGTCESREGLADDIEWYRWGLPAIDRLL
jgi:hypothetical protein